MTLKRRNVSPGVEKMKRMFEESDNDEVRKRNTSEKVQSDVQKQVQSIEKKSEKSRHMCKVKPKSKVENLKAVFEVNNKCKPVSKCFRLHPLMSA